MDSSVFSHGTAEDYRERTLRIPQILSVLRRRAVLIVVCTLAGATAAYLYAKSLPPSYTASASIAIEGQSYSIPELQGAVRTENMTDPMPLVRTELQALMSRQLIQSVIGQLGLDRMAEFNPALRPPTWINDLKSLVQRELPIAPAADRPAGEQAVQDEVLRSLVLSQDNRSLVIGVSFTAHDPKLAAAVVDSLIEQYMARQAQRRGTNNQTANTEMLQQIDAVRSKLGTLEASMRQLRVSNEMVGLRAGSIGQQQLEELATAAAKASLDRAQIASQYASASALAKSGASGNLNDVLASPTISNLRTQESEAAQKLADMTSSHGPSFPGLQSAQSSLEMVRSQLQTETQRIVASLATQLGVARAREADTQKQLEAARNRAVKVENAQAELNELQQEVIAQRALYQSLLQGAQRTTAQSGSSELGLSVRVLSAAVPSASPSSPNMKLSTAMGGAGGMLFGVLLAFLRGTPADKLSVAADRCIAARLPLLATMPRLVPDPKLLARVMDAPSGPEAEALRLLRTRVRAMGPSGTARSVVFTALQNDGDAAAMAAAFASVAARDGETVVLVEGNLAAPRLASLHRVKTASYLPILEGEADWRGALLSDQQIRLDFLLQAQPVAAKSELLGQARFQNLLMDLQHGYDLTVISGPRESHPSAQALCTEVEATILVIRVDQASVQTLQGAASRLLSAARGRAAAVVTAASRRG